MVVGGLPMPRADHAEAVVEMALDMQQEIDRFNKSRQDSPSSKRVGVQPTTRRWGRNGGTA